MRVLAVFRAEIGYQDPRLGPGSWSLHDWKAPSWSSFTHDFLCRNESLKFSGSKRNGGLMFSMNCYVDVFKRTLYIYIYRYYIHRNIHMLYFIYVSYISLSLYIYTYHTSCTRFTLLRFADFRHITHIYPYQKLSAPCQPAGNYGNLYMAGYTNRLPRNVGLHC